MFFTGILFLWVRNWTRLPQKDLEGTSWHFGIFTRFIKVKECSLCIGSCSRLGPYSKLQGMEKWESNAWLFVNCLASPWVQPEFVSKKKNKVTWTFSWLSPPASPLFPPFLATRLSQSFWRERLSSACWFSSPLFRTKFGSEHISS